MENTGQKLDKNSIRDELEMLRGRVNYLDEVITKLEETINPILNNNNTIKESVDKSKKLSDCSELADNIRNIKFQVVDKIGRLEEIIERVGL